MKITIHPGVAKDVSDLFIKVVKKLNKVSPLPKKVELHCVPAYTVTVKDDGGCGFGVFTYNDSRVLIGIAGKYSRQMLVNDGVSRQAWLAELPMIIAHEWVHMEQWREGKPLSHRGIEKRAAKLLESPI